MLQICAKLEDIPIFIFMKPQSLWVFLCWIKFTLNLFSKKRLHLILNKLCLMVDNIIGVSKYTCGVKISSGWKFLRARVENNL